MKRRFFAAGGFSPVVWTALVCSGIFSCRLWELRDPSGIETYPAEADTVVSDTDTIRVSFPFSPDHASVEAIFSVKDFMGTVSGRFHWEGNTLRFFPEPELKPGLRYVLSISGTVRDAEGRPYEVYCNVPFFYQYRAESAPHVVSVDPSRGEIISGTTGIQISFNREMDPSSFEKGLSLSPNTPYELQWTEPTHRVLISPRERWQDRTLYTLSFGEGIVDRKGMPLSPPLPTSFLVQEDTTRPYVLSVEVALDDGASFPALGPDLNTLLRYRDPIRITFSEPMDRGKTRSAVQILPSLPGTRTWLDDRVLLFIPSAGWETGVTYTLLVGNDAIDQAGNRLLPFTPFTFSPRIEPLAVEILLVEDGILLTEDACSPTQSRTLSLFPPSWSDYTFRFTFRGGSFLTDEEKLSAQRGIALSCIFPPSSPSPIPQGYSWVGGNQLSITYTGLAPSTDTEQYFYLLTLKAGAGGIRTSEGNSLRKDILQLFVTGRR